MEIRSRHRYAGTVDIYGADEEFSFFVPAGTEEEQNIHAKSRAEEIARDWVLSGSWNPSGASVTTYITLADADSTSASVIWEREAIEVAVPPNHEYLIRDVMGSDGCGVNPAKHIWTSEGEGGLDENPGVWSLGGTTFVFKSHCAACGLRRTITDRGSQRNPGEAETTVEYYAPLEED